MAKENNDLRKKFHELVRHTAKKGKVSESKVVKCSDYGYRLHKAMSNDVAKILLKYLETCPEDKRLSVLYLADGLLTKCNRKIGKKDKYRGALKGKLPGIFERMKYGSQKEKNQLGKILVKWRDFNIYSSSFIDLLSSKASVELPNSGNSNKAPPQTESTSVKPILNPKDILSNVTDMNLLNQAYEQLKSQNEVLSKAMKNAQNPSEEKRNTPKAELNRGKRVRFEASSQKDREGSERDNYDKKPRVDFNQQRNQEVRRNFNQYSYGRNEPERNRWQQDSGRDWRDPRNAGSFGTQRSGYNRGQPSSFRKNVPEENRFSSQQSQQGWGNSRQFVPTPPRQAPPTQSVTPKWGSPATSTQRQPNAGAGGWGSVVTASKKPEADTASNGWNTFRQ